MTDTTRRATGWPRTGKDQSATTAHSTSTGTAQTPRADDAARLRREAKWSARDHLDTAFGADRDNPHTARVT